jgi:hypothetical protein
VNKNTYLGWLFAGTIVAGCQSSQDGSAVVVGGDEPVAQQLSVGPGRPVNFVQHAVLAFRPDHGAMVGGYQTHAASISDGIVAVTPFTFQGQDRHAHAPITLETTAITMDDAVFGSGLTSSRLEDGVVILQRGEVEERLENYAEGLHQEWRFASAPELEGDLVVEVVVSNYKYASSTAHGLHFVSAAGDVGVRYSHAVWSGADGTDWPINATYDNGRIRMTVPAGIVAKTTFPAVLDPTVSAEVAADAAVVGSTGANTLHAAMAFGANEYLVVWDDTRESADSDIWGTRLSTTGAILDPLGIKIGTGAGVQSNPSVAYNGTTFLVAWEDFKVPKGTEADIKATTVSTTATVGTVQTVAATTASETKPGLAARSDGNALLVWNTAGAISGAIYTTTFGSAFAIATGALVERPGIAANPTGNYLVAWSAATDLKGQLVTNIGTLSGAAFNISAASGTQYAATVAFDGTNYDVVWDNNSGGINLYGTAVSTAGVVLNTRTEGMAMVGGVSVSLAADNQEVPNIACQSTGCLVVWQDRRNLATTGYDIYGQLMNLNFTPNGAEFLVSNAASGQNAPVAASSGAGYFTAWQDLRDLFAFTAFGSTVSSTGAVGANASLVSGNNGETGPHLGLAGGVFGLFWSDSRTYGNDIRYVRFNTNGSKLDATSRIASSAPLAQFTPAASSDLGGNMYVVWSDTRGGLNKDIYGARVTSAGSTLDAAGVAITTATGDQIAPDVASNGTVALVVWQDRRNPTSDIYGALINSSGAVTVADIVISNAVSDQTRPAVTWDPTSSQFIVVWGDSRSGLSHVFGARVSSAGVVLDTTGVGISNAPNGEYSPAITSSPSGSYAVWQDRRDAPAQGYHIYGTRLSGGTALTVLDAAGLKISNATGNQDLADVASLGTSYAVVWVDNRASQSDVYGQQITIGGALSGPEFAVSATTNPETSVSIRGGGTNLARVTYESRVLQTSRVETRLISTSSTQGGACSGPGQCVSGFCVDGFCCDSACGGNDNTDCQSCAFSKTGQPSGTCSPMPTTTICRNYANSFCDQREYCPSAATPGWPACPPDIGRNAGLTCSKTNNVPAGTGSGTCPSAAAPGPHTCN